MSILLPGYILEKNLRVVRLIACSVKLVETPTQGQAHPARSLRALEVLVNMRVTVFVRVCLQTKNDFHPVCRHCLTNEVAETCPGSMRLVKT